MKLLQIIKCCVTQRSQFSVDDIVVRTWMKMSVHPFLFFLLRAAPPGPPVSCSLCSGIHGTLTQWSRPELARSLSKPFSSFRDTSTRVWRWTLMEQVCQSAVFCCFYLLFAKRTSASLYPYGKMQLYLKGQQVQQAHWTLWRFALPRRGLPVFTAYDNSQALVVTLCPMQAEAFLTSQH